MPEAGETVDQVAAVGGIGEQFPVLEDMAVEEVSPVPDDVEGISEEEAATLGDTLKASTMRGGDVAPMLTVRGGAGSAEAPLLSSEGSEENAL